MRPVRSAARTMLSAIFVVNGLRSAMDPGPFMERAKPVTDRVTPLLRKSGLPTPADPATLVRIHGAVEAVAGLALASGRLTRPAAVVLAGTLVPTTIAGHPYWKIDDPAQRAGQRIQFMKNLGLLGGLLLAAVDTQGRPGLGWRASHAVQDGRRSMRRAVRTARRDARTAMKSVKSAAAVRLPG
ncbi:DoxX family protein [Micromonospora sp. NPDC049559]|uniref:DoxX family protein n=1 Tax=Micromonospora sp. NPDC049559 TaxID=3155923 RepID=UPI0034396729